MQHSLDDGVTWTPVTSLPAGTRVASDRVDPAVFYAAGGGQFFTSHDGGATFAPSSFDGLPTEGNIRLAATPDHAGHVWVAGGEAEAGPYGMWRSTDGGATFSAVDALGQADTIGFGLNAPGFDYLALYSSAEVDGVRGIYRSLDEGESWQRINDDQHQWAWTGAEITGDLEEFGRVYIATNGRGIVVGTTDVIPVAPSTDPTTTTTLVLTQREIRRSQTLPLGVLAIVQSSNGTAQSGKLELVANGQVYATIPVRYGLAGTLIPARTLPVGTYQVTARFIPSGNAVGSTSMPVQLGVR